MKKLLKNRKLVISLSILVLICGALIISVLSSWRTLNRMSIREVTTTDMAVAMREDRFWSTYRYNTLLFEATVQSVYTNNDIKYFSFKTSDSYRVSCSFINQNTELKIGQTYKIAVETYDAHRQPHSVLLNDCVKI